MRLQVSRSAVRTTRLAFSLVKVRPRWLLLVSVLICLLSLAGCSKDAQPANAVASVATTNATEPDQTGASITANPNPVPAGPGLGKSTITWKTADGSSGQVYVSEGGNAEKLFAGESSQGSLDAPWIGPGATYEFRLYAGKEHQKILASVQVIRSEK
jgi:hypothetical protein